MPEAVPQDAAPGPFAPTLAPDLMPVIEAAWQVRDTLSAATTGPFREAVAAALAALDDGTLRVAEPAAQFAARSGAEGWIVHAWLKKAVLLSFRLHDSAVIPGACAGAPGYDKVALKTTGWTDARFRNAGFRIVPGTVIRHSAYVAPGAILMPCFVNVGAHVGRGTMIDTWATVGSCAQVGANCHISGGAGIGGVLEPLQASPTIIEDDCFIGARSEVVEGVVVGRGSVLAMGVFLSASTPVIDRTTGEVFRGHVPPYSVVVPGTRPGSALPDGSPGPALACAVIVKRVDAQTRAKTSPNALLRD